MPIGQEDHRGVTVAVAIALGRFHEPLDLGLGQVLAGAQVAVGEALGGNCSFYGVWRDQFEVRFAHAFPPSSLLDCSYKNPSRNSVKASTRACTSPRGRRPL